MVLTATGYVPIEANAGGEESNASREIKQDIGNDSAEQRTDKALLKASLDDPKHPGWRAGAPGGKGGQFRPKDGDASDAGPTPGALTGGSNGSAASNSGNAGVILVQDKVTPHGFTVDQVPGDPLDPQKLNKPISPGEQRKIADTLNLILNQEFGTLHPHAYDNYPHLRTGAVLPPSIGGYTAFDVPGLGSGRGEGRIVIDAGTGAMYYTNKHYWSFYRP